MTRLRVLVLFLLSGLTCGCATSPHESVAPTIAESSPVVSISPASPVETDRWKIPPRPDDELKKVQALEVMNKLFRETYEQARAAQQAENDLVILTRFSGATLIRNGVPVETARVIPSLYHNLRYAAHVPFAVFLGLARECDHPIAQARQEWATHYVEAIDAARQGIAELGLTSKQKERQERLLDGARALLKKLRQEKSLSCERLADYARANSRDIEQNIFEAGVAQVDGLHKQISAWRAQISDAEWQRVHFIVHGPQQPRAGHAAVIYLSALVQDSGDFRGYVGESGRVVYREDTSLPSKPETPAWEPDLQLLAAVDMDAKASEAIFSDPDRLAVDIAAQGARARVRELDLSSVRIGR